MKRIRPLAIALLLLAFAPLSIAQTDTPQTLTEPDSDAQSKPTDPSQRPSIAEEGFVLRELLVLHADRYDDTANNPKLIPTTLSAPVKHAGRDKRVDPDGAPVYTAMPVGLITFQGQLTEPLKLRLTLGDPRDRFHAHWPGNTIEGSRFVQWQADAINDEAIPVASFADSHDWLATLRTSNDRVWVQSIGSQIKERFVLYDVSLKFKPAIDLSVTNDQYRLTLKGGKPVAPPLSLLLRKTQDGWSADALAAPWPSKTSVISTRSNDSAAAPITLAEALAPIKGLLAAQGYTEQEIEVALAMVASAGFDKSNMSLVYILPNGETDRYVRLQVRPTPDKLIRTTIVVVNNVDPDLSSVVNALLDDLGSEDWLKRDRAQRELTTLGQAAIKKVQQLKNSDDPEIAFRAQQILSDHDWKMDGGE